MSKHKNSTKYSSIKIGILETYGHVPILYTFSRICKTENTTVTIFTTRKLFSRLEKYLKKTEGYNIVLKKDNESYFSFLKRVENICNQNIDLLFINTIKENPVDLICYLKFHPKCNMILAVHHINTWLKTKFVYDITNIRKMIETNLSEFLIRNFILPKFDALNVIYHPLRDYILTNTDYEKEIFTLPTSIFEDSKRLTIEQKDDKLLRIVSPGIIAERRKDYYIVLPVFEKIFNNFNENIILQVLGTPVGKYGRTIYNEFKKMRDKGHNVVIYDEFVPDDKYVNILTKSDIILAPVQINTWGNICIKEKYGITVGSGIIFDAIRYSKPIIVPAEFNMLRELNSSTLKYANSTELENVLKDLIFNPEKLDRLKKEALLNSQKFSSQTIQNYFNQKVVKWLLKN